MSRYAVVAYPTMAEDAAARIEEVRRQHDPQAGLLPAHFSLMFPILASRDALIGHVTETLQRHRAFDVLFHRAAIHRDVGSTICQVYLLTSAGDQEIQLIHDELYGGSWSRFLRKDLPYTPHVTVARTRHQHLCEAVSAELAERGLGIAARVAAADVIEMRSDAVTSIARLTLGTPAAG